MGSTYLISGHSFIAAIPPRSSLILAPKSLHYEEDAQPGAVYSLFVYWTKAAIY
jgi:hypothetical protein